MDPRQRRILEAIIDTFIKTGLPVGSMHIRHDYEFNVSPATIRNEMARLEREGFIMQPHTSAGRIPTNQAYRMFVDEMTTNMKVMNAMKKKMESLSQKRKLKEVKEKLYDIVTTIANVTDNISFASVPGIKRVFYIGISNMLKKPEFLMDPDKTTRVIEVIENDLYQILSDLDLNEEGSFYIGEENILKEFQSCSMLTMPYSTKGFDGAIGIIGSTRMDYPYNFAALKTAVQLLKEV